MDDMIEETWRAIRDTKEMLKWMHEQEDKTNENIRATQETIARLRATLDELDKEGE